MTGPGHPRSLPELAEACDQWTRQPREIIRTVARDAGPAMHDAIVTAGHWGSLSPTERAGVVWDMTTAHGVGTTDARHFDVAGMGVRMAELAAAIRYAHLLSGGHRWGPRIDGGRLADEANASLRSLPEGWRAEGLRRIALGGLDPLGAARSAAMAINMARNVYGIAPE